MEKTGGMSSLARGRTVNRNRSPRLKASGRQNNVGKGSRQTRSVTSGKGLAPRIHVSVGGDSCQVRVEVAADGAFGSCPRLLKSLGIFSMSCSQ